MDVGKDMGVSVDLNVDMHVHSVTVRRLDTT